MARKKTDLQQIESPTQIEPNKFGPCEKCAKKTHNEPSIQEKIALPERKQKSKSLEDKRKREMRKFNVGVFQEVVITLFAFIVLTTILYYVGQRILDPIAPQGEKQLAFGIVGTIVGAVCTYLFTKKSG